MKRTLILTHSQYQDQELIYPFYRIAGEYGVDSISLYSDAGAGLVKGITGLQVPSTHHLDQLLDTAHRAESVLSTDILIIPGGVKAMEKLRQHVGALATVRDFMSTGKTVGVICSGAQLMISAKVLNGRRVSAYYAMQVDVENAGAIYDPGPVATCGNIISAPHYKDMGEWMNEVLRHANG